MFWSIVPTQRVLSQPWPQLIDILPFGDSDIIPPMRYLKLCFSVSCATMIEPGHVHPGHSTIWIECARWRRRVREKRRV